MKQRTKHTERCEYCTGEVRSRRVVELHGERERMVIVEGVPVGECDRCGERYYDAVVVRKLESLTMGLKTRLRCRRVPFVRFSSAKG